METEHDKALRLDQRDLGDVKVLMGTVSGRRFLYRLLSASGMYAVPGGLDPYFLAFHAGQRSIGLWVAGEIEDGDAEAYHELMIEQTHEEHNGNEFRRSDD